MPIILAVFCAERQLLEFTPRTAAPLLARVKPEPEGYEPGIVLLKSFGSFSTICEGGNVLRLTLA